MIGRCMHFDNVLNGGIRSNVVFWMNGIAPTTNIVDSPLGDSFESWMLLSNN
jgi:hypothetical protein